MAGWPKDKMKMAGRGCGHLLHKSLAQENFLVGDAVDSPGRIPKTFLAGLERLVPRVGGQTTVHSAGQASALALAWCIHDRRLTEVTGAVAVGGGRGRWQVLLRGQFGEALRGAMGPACSGMGLQGCIVLTLCDSREAEGGTV